jgi:hypothetical protein
MAPFFVPANWPPAALLRRAPSPITGRIFAMVGALDVGIIAYAAL